MLVWGPFSRGGAGGEGSSLTVYIISFYYAINVNLYV